MSPSRKERYREFTEQLVAGQFGGFQVEGDPGTLPVEANDEMKIYPRESLFIDFGQQEAMSRFHFERELFERKESSNLFRKVLMGGDANDARDFFISQIVIRFMDYLRRSKKADFRHLNHDEYERASRLAYWSEKRFRLYLTLATITGLVSVKELQEIFKHIPVQGQIEKGVSLRDWKKSTFASLKERLIRNPRERFSSTEEAVAHIRAEQDEAARLQMKITYCVYPGVFRPATFSHAIIGNLLKGIVSRVVWMVTSNDAYHRLVQAGEKQKRDFDSHDALATITGLPCFGKYDEIIESNVLIMQDGVEKWATSLSQLQGVEYVYVAVKSESLYQQRVRAAQLVGKKIITGPDLGVHGKDIQREYRRFIEIIKSMSHAFGHPLAEDEMKKLLPDLMKWR